MYVKYIAYNCGMMTNAEIKNVINAYHEWERAERNRVLRTRLERPLSSEEHLKRLASLSDFTAPRQGREIPLTNSSSQYIMDTAR